MRTKRFRKHHARINWLVAFFCIAAFHVQAQETQIRGFAEVLAGYSGSNQRMSFGLGEQDLFITSELTDRFSFLGESVFKYSASSPTLFDISIERIVVKYNFKGNHNILIGKHHTPINYWNDTYHHGRVFFPTIYRPDMFGDHFIPLHTTGISVQGHDLGKWKFGYDLMVGNGIGSGETADNDEAKSLTAAVHIKPIEHLRIGVSFYNDKIAAGSKDAHASLTVPVDVAQQLYSGSLSYFGKTLELLVEGTAAMDHTDSTGSKQSFSGYGYAGVRLKKIIPYVRVDYSQVPEGELFFHHDTKTSFVGGLRYEINYLTVIKLEYGHTENDAGKSDGVTAQIAIGF
jgi:hypothetical protein